MKFIVVAYVAASLLLAGCDYKVETRPVAPTNYRPMQEKVLQTATSDRGFADDGLMCKRDDYDPEAQ